uniref:Eukaryotic translation initiation factor 4 gamma, 1a n=1 Tax=Electrophorus electricus TaxID=8005 RepID=A0A4W4H8B0_ELEEL
MLIFLLLLFFIYLIVNSIKCNAPQMLLLFFYAWYIVFLNIFISHHFSQSLFVSPQPYYASRATLPANSARVQPSSAPRTIPPPHGTHPPHVFQPGSQMMMIPQQPISFPNSQAPAYYIHGQVRPKIYHILQHPWCYWNDETLNSGMFSTCVVAGAYYSTQPQFTPPVPTAPVIMNPAPQQQQAPPSQQQVAPTKRERKQIRIRDPNQGGRDITEEIMSGGRSAPTPPQVTLELTTFASQLVGDKDRVKPVVSLEFPIPPGESPIPDTPPTPPPTSPISDAVDIPPPITVTDHMIPSTMEMVAPPAQPKDMIKRDMKLLPVTIPQSTNGSVSSKEIGEGPVTVSLPVSTPKCVVPEPTTDRDISPIAEPDVTKEAPPVVEKNSARTIKAITPLGKETPIQVFKEIPVPVVKESYVPGVKDIPTLVVKETSVPLVKESPSALAKEIASPFLKETPSVVAKEISASVVKETSTPVAKETPAPVVKETPDLKETPVVKEMPPPVAKQTSEPVVKATPAPVVKELCPVAKESPEPVVNENPAPSEALSEASKTMLPPSEEREDTPPPQTTAPESTMQGMYQWKPLNPEEKKKYDREFLLGFQFISASMHKPEGLPHISDVVLDKANKTPLRPLDPSRLPGMNCGPDFTPSFANLGRQPPAGMGGPRRSGQGPRKEPRKIIASVSLSDDVQLNRAEKAWRPSGKRGSRSDEDDPEGLKTQELLRRVRSVLNKLTPQMFQPLMKQVTELTIDTEERLKGVIDLIFEKAISEPNFSVAYANMCRCLMALKVRTCDKPGGTVNFRKLLLNRCQKEFEKDKDDDETFEKKQRELDASTVEEERQRLKEELEEGKDKARRRSLGNIKFIGELFKLKMLTEPIMHDCIVKLLKNHDEESLECLCRLLSTIGKDLDFEKAKPRMDQYFNQMEKIIKERKTSSRIRFMLQDVLDLRRNIWVPRRGDQGPKTIDQIHKDAEMEEHREHIKVQQQLLSKKETRGGGGGVGLGPRTGPHTPGSRSNQAPDEGWNTVPISTKTRPIDTTRLSKITKPGALDFSNQLLAPGGKGTWGSWGKGSSGGSGAKPTDTDSGRTSTLNRFSALQQPSSSSSSNVDADRRVPQRSSSSRERGFERADRGGSERSDRRDERAADRIRATVGKRSFSREAEERGSAETVRRVASMTDERERPIRDRAPSKENVRRESATMPPPAPSKPALTAEELEKKSTAIIEEYLHINDLKEALQCVSELNCATLLSVLVRTGIESTLERSSIARQHMGLLLRQLVKVGTLSTPQFYKGLLEVLEVAEDMAIDIPHIWVYLAELITPMLHEGGIPMGPLFREMSKPLVPISKAGDLLAHILNLHKKVGVMWREAGLSWKDFLAEDEDLNKFVTEKEVEYTLGEECVKTSSSRKAVSPNELSKQLDQLLEDKADNERVSDWVEANLDEYQAASDTFVRALMTSICQAAIICENPYKVDSKEISQRAKLLQRYIKDEHKELQALYALQSLMVQMEQPPNLLRMFFDVLYDEDVIKEEGFYKWESSKDPAEQQGKGVALKSVTAFFTWLREAEDESDNS